MIKHLLGCLLIGMLMFASGCAVCGSPFDDHYSAYGGAWERGDPSHGRVGSVFQPAGSAVPYMSASEAAEWTPSEDGPEAAPGDRSILTPREWGTVDPGEDEPPALDSLLQQ